MPLTITANPRPNRTTCGRQVLSTDRPAHALLAGSWLPTPVAGHSNSGACGSLDSYML